VIPLRSRSPRREVLGLLSELRIINFAIIDDLRLRFAPGLNVLTGETGAGKSIVVDAVELVIGGRASSDVVRAGAESAVVDALFDVGGIPQVGVTLEELGLDRGDGGELLLSREVLPEGRSVARINGRTATATMVRRVATDLIDIHGQHEHQSLLHRDSHLDLLDRFGGESTLSLRACVAELYGRLAELERLARKLAGDRRERARRVDLLRYQIQEIDRARLSPGEDEELSRERRVLTNAEMLFAAASEAFEALYEGRGEGGSAVDLVGRAEELVQDAARADPSLGAHLEALRGARYQLEEVSRELRAYREGVEFSPERLSEVEERLDEIRRLEKKYGEGAAGILEYRVQAVAELEGLAGSEERLASVAAERRAVEREYVEAAVELSRARRGAAGAMSERVVEELSGLAMGRARFEVSLAQREDAKGVEVDGRRLAPGPRGFDRAEFVIAPNPGEPPRALSRIASGGEMARVMLALKSALADVDRIPTMIFDEVDAGIGGRVASAVAEKLADVAATRQVVCVTHLPQIAAAAQAHFAVQKRVKGGRTIALARRLSDRGRVDELSRMLGGSAPDDVVLEHARRLLEEGRRRKHKRARRRGT